MKTYTFGADPEVFLFNDKGFVPAYVLLPETKKGQCLPVTHGGIHSDNVMLELNPDPSGDIYEVVYRCNYMAGEFCRRHGVFYLATSVHQFTNDECEALYDNRRYFEFGCDPDWNAYTEERSPSAELPSNVRVAGGHLMISAPDIRLYNPEIAFIAIKWMDILVAPLLPCYGTQQSQIRRQWYGKAGSFRPKKFSETQYGLEYRVPGPEWMSATERTDYLQIQEAMIESVERALQLEIPTIEKTIIFGAINESNNKYIKKLSKAA